MSLVNYLGTYETLDQVWEAYPEGGKEGDYLYIASVLKKWDKYASAWADPTEEDVDGSTIMSLEEDVVVGSSTLINYLGRFETLGDTLNAYPEGGNEGDYIYVGDDIYAWDKYANEWVVSLDAPLEVTISEEDIIPNSNTFINYLGGFVDRDAVWHKYPEGGKVGDYLYIASDLHIWDKYICNWVAATPPDESSQIRPIEHLSQEGVVEYSENYINYLGVFESIEQAWEAYPEGGKEGDYIIVGGEQLRWNKYTANWGEYDPDASTPARPVATIYGDLHVHNDVIIGEDLYARILETFTTKKWVLEQGYISLDDVTSELVMSKIVPDNTTIEVRDGKLVVIGGGGGGTADSVAWDDVTGKPEWIGDTKPTYTLDEIAGSNGDGFVTLLSDQTIEGVKNFANGAKFNGALLSYDEEKKAWVFPGNIIASGGITAFGSLSTPVASLFEALPIDGTTIKRDPVTNELYVDTTVVGGGGSGGGSVDPSQLEAYLKPYAKTADVASTYATIASLSAVTSRLNDFLSGSDTDTIINKWSELETFLAGLAETDDLATILSGKANKATTLAGYGITDAYTKSHIDSNFVTIGTKQRITGEKDFVGGFKVNGGLVEYNATLKAWVFNGDLLVTGGMAAFSNISGFKPSTITEAVLIDNKTIKLNADGLLYAVPQGAGGINEDQLADYLTTNGYATQSWVTDKGYITSSALEPYALKTAIPTKLSQLTDDVVSGKYLSIAGGTVNGAVTINHSGNTPLVINQNYGTASNPRGVVVMNSTLSNNNFYISHLFGKEGSMRNSAWVGFYLDSAGSNNNRLSMGLYGVDNVLNILGSSNVAIGGTTASEKLHVYGNILATGTVSGAGGKFADNVSIAEGKNIMMRSANAQYYAGIGYDTSGNECLAMWAKNTVTRLRWSAGVDFSAGITIGAMMGITPDFEISKATGAAIGYIAGNTILHSDNYSKYALPLTGGTVNGDIYSKNYRTDGVAYIQTLRIENSNEINGYSAYNGGLANGNVHLNYISSGNVTLCNGGGNCAVGGIYASEKLHVHGNILATGGVTATNSSDERLKRNLRKFNASKVLMSLGGVYEYEYIDSEAQKNHIYEGTHYGLIYQHVKDTTLDVMCHEREDGMGALNYIHPKFISLIAGATMENISEVEKLKRKIRHLEAKVKQLENRA